MNSTDRNEGELMQVKRKSPRMPLKVYLNEGIGQLLFFQGAGPCETTYADRKGRYQNQIDSPVLGKGAG